MKRVVIAAAVAAVSGTALADDVVKVGEDPKFVFAKPDDAKPVKDIEWHAAIEGGLLIATGNAETTNVSAGFKVSRRQDANKLALEAAIAYAKAGLLVLDDRNGNGLIDNQTEIIQQQSITAETFDARLRYDRFLTNYNSLYAAALAGRDVPAGKLAVLGGQIGYSRRLYKSKTAEAVAEVGGDYSHEHLVTGSPVNVVSVRGFVGDKTALTEGTDFEASLEALTNLNHETLPTMQDGSAFEDTRMNLHLAISAKIGKNLAVSTSFDAKYDHRPGPLSIKNLAMDYVPAAAPLETIMKAQLIYTFATGTPPPPPPKKDDAGTPSK
ncbi:MAG TPA: DUF481 domain-containing protein [Kofleriaceae bacterium]|nr:DUF481 domain-containing protein [Kofleriaceae bacterium]